MDEVWDDDAPVVSSTSHSAIENGTNFGRGRGFIPQETYRSPGGLRNEDEWKNDTPSFSNSYQNGDRDRDLREDNDSFESRGDFRGKGDRRGRGGERRGRGGDRGSRGGDRGGRGGDRGGRDGDKGGRGSYRGGRGGERGGYQDDGFRNNKNDDDENENENKSNGNPDGKPRELYIPAEPSEDENVIFGSNITSGINFDKFAHIKIKVTGENPPHPIDNFESSGLREFVQDNVKKSGYKVPTPVQKNAIPIIMAGRDLMACAQTGSGKTAAFLLPIINTILAEPKELIITAEHCEPHAVIISPTRELTVQIYNEARKFSHGSMVKVVVAYGGVAGYYQAQQLMKGCHILVATPGRLNDFVQRGRLKFSSVRFLVLDEADRMLDMGFMPHVERLVSDATMVQTGGRQTLMFSATFPEEVQRLAGKFLDNYLFLAVGIVGGACTDVEQKFHLVTKFEKRPKLVDLIKQEGQEKTLVFVETKRTADFLAAYLSEHDFPTTSIHGDRLQREREEALRDFKCGQMGILVATGVAARGLDIKNVAHVVNYDLPKSIDEYVHRIGRTGRVGNRGKATSFYDPEADALLSKGLIKILQQAEQEVPAWLEKDSSSSSFSSHSFSNQFGGRDVRKFKQNSSEPDSMFGGTSNYSQSQPQPLEPEEEW